MSHEQRLLLYTKLQKWFRLSVVQYHATGIRSVSIWMLVHRDSSAVNIQFQLIQDDRQNTINSCYGITSQPVLFDTVT